MLSRSEAVSLLLISTLSVSANCFSTVLGLAKASWCSRCSVSVYSPENHGTRLFGGKVLQEDLSSSALLGRTPDNGTST